MNEKFSPKKPRAGSSARCCDGVCRVPAPPPPVEVASVVTGTYEQAIEEDGRLRITIRYVITAPTQAAVLLNVGDVVKAGDVLATLEPVAPQMIDARTRGVLQQRLGSADAARRAAKAQVQRAHTALACAEPAVAARSTGRWYIKSPRCSSSIRTAP